MTQSTLSNTFARIVFLCCILLIPSRMFSSNTYTSTGAGGNWNAPGSWSETPGSGGFPIAGDSVIIASGSPITINVTSSAQSINIQSGATLTVSAAVTLTNSLQLDGTLTGTSSVTMNSAGNLFIGGSQSQTFNGLLVFPGSGAVYIRSGVVINNAAAYDIVLGTGAVVHNSGTISVNFLYSAAGASWINAANSSLSVFANFRTVALDATASPNTVIYANSTTNILSGTYYNLTLTGGSGRNLTGATVVQNNLFINGLVATLNGAGFSLTLGGNLTNSDPSSTFSTLDLTLNGSGAQTLSKVSGTETIKSLTVNNSGAGSVTLSTPYVVTTALTLTNGSLNTTSSNTLTLNNGATLTGGSNTSFVSGPMIKIGNSAFTFPLGSASLGASAYHPLSISAPSVATDKFNAQYVAVGQALGFSTDDSVQSMSTCEYWNLTRSAGSSNVQVTLGWNANNCSGATYTSYRIASFDGTQWNNQGEGSFSVAGSTGTITTRTALTFAQSSQPLCVAQQRSTSTVFTSTGAGGNWNSAASWTSTGGSGSTPAAGDSVVIASGSPITVNVASAARSINIQSGASLTISSALALTRFFQFDGTATGSGAISMTNSANVFIGGSHANTLTSSISFLGGGSVFIQSSVVLNNSGSGSGISLAAATTVHNLGTITTLRVNGAAGASWINGANSSLTSTQNLSGITINASAIPNTVTYANATTTILGATYYNLTLVGGSNRNLTGATVVQNNFFINGLVATLSGAGFSLSVAGNVTDNDPSSSMSTVDLTLNGAGAQSISKVSNATEALKSLTVTSGGTVTLANPISTVNALTINSGTLDVSASNLAVTVGGNLTINGTFNARAGTVTLNGSSAQSVGGTGCSFYTLVSNSTSTVTLGAAITCAKALTLNTGTFDVSASNFQVSVAGNLTIKNTFTPHSGKILLNGSTAQSIIGTAGATVPMYDLTVNNAAGATFTAGAWTIADALTAQSGVIKNSADSVKLLSNSATTAYTANGAGSYSGTFIIQRYIAGRTANWQDLSCPVTGTTLLDWNKEMFMSGVGGPNGNAGGFISVKNWSEATKAYVNVTSEIPLVPMVCYTTWAADDPSNWVAKAIDSHGTPVSGNQVASLTYTAGSDAGDNRIGNPYPSPITWNGALGTNLLQSTIYVMVDGNYAGFGNGTVLPASQGFCLYAKSGGGSVTFTEACKSATSSSVFAGHRKVSFDLSFKVSSPSLTDYYQQNYIDFNDNAGLGFDPELEHLYIKSPETKAPSLCMVTTDGNRLTRNAFSASTNETVVVPMKMTVGIDGTYTLETSGAANMTEYSCALMEDLQSHKVIDLKQQPNYTFDAKTTDNPDRFMLHLTRRSTSCEEVLTSVKPADAFFTNNQIRIYSNDGAAYIKFDLDQTTKALVSVYDLQGRSIMNEVEVDAFKETVNFNLADNAAGLYLVKVNLGGNHIVSKKILLNH